MPPCTLFRQLNAYAALRQGRKAKTGKIYYMICIKSTGDQVIMVTKPRTLGPLGNSKNTTVIIDIPRISGCIFVSYIKIFANMHRVNRPRENNNH